MAKKSFLIAVLGVLTVGLFVQAAPQSNVPQSASKDEIPGMALIPAGEFWMGRTTMWLFDELSWTVRDRLDDQPAHVVSVDAFYMDKYEVTQEDYARFAEATAHRKPWHWKDGRVRDGREKWPMYNASWDDALEYCTWVGKRLPSEAEWERAARGGLDRKLYSWGDDVGEARPRGETAPRYGSAPAKKRARYGDMSPVPVGSFEPNGYGLYDVTGNVWEWVADWYDRDYYATQPFNTPSRNPKGPENGIYRVLRGGGFPHNEGQVFDRSIMGVHYRNYAPPSQISIAYGFRCAKSVDASSPSQQK